MDSELRKIKTKWELQKDFLTERQRRLWAGAEALVLGRGGVKVVMEATGLSQPTVSRGKREAQALKRGEVPKLAPETSRKPGAGRPVIEDEQDGIRQALMVLVEPATRGEPESPLLWTSKSLRKLVEELNQQDFLISPQTVARILHDEGFSLQAARKTHEGSKNPDRNAQFEKINEEVKDFHARNQPVVSIDTKKKELIGEFKNNGQEWQPKGQPEEVNAYDFPSLAEGRANPYGIYDIFRNEGWVSVGVSADTAEFSVNSIRQWWYQMGQAAYPEAHEILMTADCGGSNGYRTRLWKSELQNLANELGLDLHVMHFPPGTSKWNKIEHRMFNHISLNWRGRSLTSYEVVINCIANTTTDEGLYIRAALDEKKYERKIKISDERMAEINLYQDEFHGEWNYAIKPF